MWNFIKIVSAFSGCVRFESFTENKYSEIFSGDSHIKVELKTNHSEISSFSIIKVDVVKSKSKSHCDWRSVNQLRSCFFLWGALSDEKTGLSFVYAAGPCQSSLSRVRVSWYSRTSMWWMTVRICIYIVWQIPGNVVPLLRNDQGKHCYIRGNGRNEHVQLLKPRQRLAKRGIDPLLCNVRAQQSFPKQRRCCYDNRGWIVKTSYRLRREVSKLSASLRGERTPREVIC
jgi:hypothetical protein